MKCITRDGKEILRVDESVAEFLVSAGRYRYTTKKKWRRCLGMNKDDPNHSDRIKASHRRSAKIAGEEIKQIHTERKRIADEQAKKEAESSEQPE